MATPVIKTRFENENAEATEQQLQRIRQLMIDAAKAANDLHRAYAQAAGGDRMAATAAAAADKNATAMKSAAESAKVFEQSVKKTELAIIAAANRTEAFNATIKNSSLSLAEQSRAISRNNQVFNNYANSISGTALSTDELRKKTLAFSRGLIDQRTAMQAAQRDQRDAIQSARDHEKALAELARAEASAAAAAQTAANRRIAAQSQQERALATAERQVVSFTASVMHSGVQQQAQARLVEAAQRQFEAYSAALKRADRNQLEAVRATNQHRAAMQQLSVELGNLRIEEQARQVGVLTNAFRLNRVGLLELQAAGVNTFQALAAGINPFHVAVMEGAQVLGALIQGGLLTFKTLLGLAGVIGSVVAVVGTFVVAFAKGVFEMKEFERVSRMTANAAGLTAQGLQDIAAAAHEASGIGTGAARSIAVEMAATGKISGSVISKLTMLTKDYAEVTGQSAEEAGAALSKSFTDPIKAANELDDAYNFLTVAQVDHIRVLSEQGDRTRAQVVLADALNDHIKNIADDGLTWLGRRLKEVGDLWDLFWDKSKGIGRGPTIEEQLANARARLAEETAGGGRVGPRFSNPAEVENIRRTITRLEGEKFVQDAATASAKAAAEFREETKALELVTRGYENYATKKEQLENQSLRFANAIQMVTDKINSLSEADLSTGALPQLLDILKRLKLGAEDTAAEFIALRTTLEASEEQTSIARKVAGLDPAQRGPRQAYLTALDQAQHGSPEDQRDAVAIAQEARKRAVIALNVAIEDQNRILSINATETLKVADAYLQSASAGQKAEAERQAANDNFRTGVDAEMRARQLLSAQVDKAIESSAKQINQLAREASQRQMVAAAALIGAEAQRKAETQIKVENATLAERQALVNASADQELRLRKIIEDKTKAIEDEARAARDLAVATALIDQKEQIQLLETQVRVIAASNEQRVVQIAHAQAMIDLHKKEGDALTENERKYVRNAEAIARQRAEYKFLEDSYNALADAGVQAFDRIGEAITQGLATGKLDMVELGNIWKAVVSEMIQTALKLAVINPILNSVFGQSRPTLSGAFQAIDASSGGASGGNNPLSSLSSITNLFGGGPGGIASSIVNSSFGASLGLSTSIGAAAGPTLLSGAGAGATAFTAAQTNALIAGGWSGFAPTSLGTGLIGAAGPIAAIAAIALPLLMSAFGGGPTVGPVGIADFSPGLGRRKAFDVAGIDPFTADNGGNGEAMRPIAEAIADLIADTADRFSATIEESLRFRVANYASPEGGSGRAQGFEVNAFIRGEAEKRVAEGLSQEQAMFEALKFAVTEAFKFDSAALAEAVSNSAATTTEELLADLEFADHFERLNKAIDDLGGTVDANTLALAQQTVATQDAARTWVDTNAKPIVDDFAKALELFPAETARQETKTITEQGVYVRGGEGGRDLTFVKSGTDQFDQLTSGSDPLQIVTRIRSVSEEVAGQSKNYADNLDRIGRAVENGAAAFDLLGQQVSGTADQVIGPAALDWMQTKANIEALRGPMEAWNEQIEAANAAFPELNAALIDVDQTISDLLDTAGTQARQNFNDSIQAQTNTARGLGVINTIQGLADARDVNLSDAAALGIEYPQDRSNPVQDLFEAQVRQSLSGASLADLNEILKSGQIVDEGARAIVMTILNEQALASVRTTEVTSMQALYDEHQRFADAANDNAKKLREAANSLLVNRDLSPLSPLDRLNEARRQFEEAYAVANDSDPNDAESQYAIQQLPSLSETLLQASRDYYASSSGYLADFARVQDALNSTALRQESIEQQQLDAMRDIETAIQDLGGSLTNQTPAQIAAAGGFDFGRQVSKNQGIYNDLISLGLPTPDAFGGGQLNALRASNPAVEAYLRAKGYADGGLVTGGVPGMDSVPLWAMPGERIFSVPHSRMLENLAANQSGGSAMVSELRALRSEVERLRTAVGESGRQVAATTAAGSLRVAGAVMEGNAATKRMASTAERNSARPVAA